MRRGFDFLFAEISVSVGRVIPRFALWLRIHEHGLQPDQLTREETLAFCREALPVFLHDHGIELDDRAARRLERALARFDPLHPSPDETFAGRS
jgi:hypothetical protein